MKLERWPPAASWDGEPAMFLFYCPGCKEPHPFDIRPGHWTWNGDMERPTFTPSLLINPSGQGPRCHLFLTDGRIQFLSDCHHELAGQTVEMVDWEGWGDYPPTEGS